MLLTLSTFIDTTPLAFCPESDNDAKKASLQAEALSKASGSVLETCWSKEMMAECVVSLDGRLEQVASLMSRIRSADEGVFTSLWPTRDIPSSIFALADNLYMAPDRIDKLKESVARSGAEMALCLLLSWYPTANVQTIASIMCKPTIGFCSCQPDSQVTTVVGDEEWAAGAVHTT